MDSVPVKTGAAPSNASAERRYAVFLDQLSVKDRAVMVKSDESREGGTEAQTELWKRLAGRMAKLAPYATKTQGSNAVRFHIPDGKYKQQVFALEYTRQGTVIAFLPDVIATAIERKLISRGSGPGLYKMGESKRGEIQLESINADTKEMTLCKPMLGWGSSALRIELGAGEDDKPARTVEELCELAAEKWAQQPGPVAPPV